MNISQNEHEMHSSFAVERLSGPQARQQKRAVTRAGAFDRCHRLTTGLIEIVPLTRYGSITRPHGHASGDKSVNHPAQPIEHVEVQTGANPDYSVIWLHGLGADGHDFEPLVPALNLPSAPSVRFVFPHAPIRPITLNGGMKMRGWYDLKSLHFDRDDNRADLDQSAGLLHALIDRERDRGIPAERLFVAGFSQGGAIALYAGVRFKQRLAGIIALSTYLPMSRETPHEASPENRSVPIFMAHGRTDPVIPLWLADKSRTQLVDLGYAVEWRPYDMDHSVHPNEIADLSRFMRTILDGAGRAVPH